MSRHEAPALYHGVYINLDRSAARRERFETQLVQFGIADRYARFVAVDGAGLPPDKSQLRIGEQGAFHSHFRALDEALKREGCIHILEDDALLSEHVRPVIEEAIGANVFERYDLLFTDMMFGCHLGMLKFLKAAFDRVELRWPHPLRLRDMQIIDLKQQIFSCLTSYVVGVRSAERLLALYREEIRRGLRLPVDLFIRECVHAGKLKAACIFPFLTSFRLEELFGSTIAGEAGAPANPSVSVLAALRYSFFVDRDLESAKRLLDAATRIGRKSTNAHHDLIVQALEFVMSDDFKEF
jgi:GR25 family glycosyltransferase involved in LPS biosynthesis